MSLSAIPVYASSQPSTSNVLKSGFLSTLASYLTSKAKTDSKSDTIAQRKRLMNSWDDVDFGKLNLLVCNILYDNHNYAPLIAEIERVAGRKREHCFYVVLSVALILILLRDAIGALTAVMTLIVPAFLTVSTISATPSHENPYLQKDQKEFHVRYWTVYAVFVTGESFLSSLIHWDLRLFRLAFMSMCLSTRIPILAATYANIMGIVNAIREVIDANNYEPKPMNGAVQKTKAS